MFLRVSANYFVNVLLCSELKLCSFVALKCLQGVPSMSQRRDTGGEVCVDVWSSIWAAVDVDVCVRERVKLLGHL